jgi:hypothetical protein
MAELLKDEFWWFGLFILLGTVSYQSLIVFSYKAFYMEQVMKWSLQKVPI